MASSAVETYLKQILLMSGGPNDDLVSVGGLATALDVVPGTVTTMVKRLSKQHLVRYERYSGVQLTQKGARIATRVLRRHRLIETLLVNVLNVHWSEVHEEAELLEHAVSERLIDRIDDVLGRPQFDPHGDPIPNRDGEIPAVSDRRLTTAEIGERLRIIRVLDQSCDFILAIDRRRIRPGAIVTVLGMDLPVGLLSIGVEDSDGTATEMPLTLPVANKLVVERA